MPNICLTFGTKTPAPKILAALNTLDGLAGWWTSASGDPREEGTLTFFFNGKAVFDMRVTRSNSKQVHWECIRGPEDWLGTRIEFELVEKADRTQLKFRHAGWKSENDHYFHCSTKWATFVLSMRDYLENGKGRPFPDDIQIND